MNGSVLKPSMEYQPAKKFQISMFIHIRPYDNSTFGLSDYCIPLTEVSKDCQPEAEYKEGDVTTCYLWSDQCKGSVLTAYHDNYNACIVLGVLSVLFGFIFGWMFHVTRKLKQKYGGLYRKMKPCCLEKQRIAREKRRLSQIQLHQQRQMI